DGVERAEKQTDFQGLCWFQECGNECNTGMGNQEFLKLSYRRCASARDVSRSSFTSTTSNLSQKDISNSALNRRRERLSWVSVPRSLSLTFKTSREGTFTKMASALSPKYFLRFNPPFTSTSKITFRPSCHTRSTSALRVP